MENLQENMKWFSEKEVGVTRNPVFRGRNVTSSILRQFFVSQCKNNPGYRISGA